MMDTTATMDSTSTMEANAKSKIEAFRNRNLPNGETTATPADALRKLFSSAETDAPQKAEDLLKILGDTKTQRLRPAQQDITKMHEDLARRYHENDKENETDQDVLRELLGDPGAQKPPYDLKYLFAHGLDGLTILHVILDRSTYPSSEFQFSRMKPLIRFLLRVRPGLPGVESTKSEGPPLFTALKINQATGTGLEDKSQPPLCFEPYQKEEIVHFLCSRKSTKGPNDDCLGSKPAVESLGKWVNCRDTGSVPGHAIHRAVESSDFRFPEDVLRALINVPAGNPQARFAKSCLDEPDEQGRTCLHIALTAPFTKSERIWWATKLAELRPDLLTVPSKVGKEKTLTPLQHLAEQKLTWRPESKMKSKMTSEMTDQNSGDPLESLEALLKRQCLSNFDNATCKRIMYNKDNSREIFLTLDEDIVSWGYFRAQKHHYKLDTTLKSVHICEAVSVHWDDASLATRDIAMKWGCVGSVDLYMVFHWLKKEVGVNKILEVVVEDGARRKWTNDRIPGSRQIPHSDQAIIQCLDGLGVESLDWQREDIPADVIVRGAGSDIKKLRLYCSGRQAVLQGWADRQGLARLQNLEEVHVEIEQGLESIQGISAYATRFRDQLQSTFRDLYPDKSLKITYTPRRRTIRTEFAESKVKDKNEQGFEEQDWLKCMDEFVDVLEAVEQSITHSGARTPDRPIRVALIDDGVKTSYAGLDENIHAGKSNWQQPGSDALRTNTSLSGPFRNYNSSHTGHGTVMAYYIKRVCPRVRLYVAKLDVMPRRSTVNGESEMVSFSRDSAAEAIMWAVDEEVDIISMSWAIERDTPHGANSLDTKLGEAINAAVKKNILLFCANPDMGPSYSKNQTLPKALNSDNIFCIGSATQDGVRWGKIHKDDDSCNYFLPGVELGIQVESRLRKNPGEPPREWRKHSGSSLSCALAAGLAAMILHCSLVSGKVKFDDETWKWLRSHEGMCTVFGNIQVERTNSGWLPVRRFFSKAIESLDGGTNNDKKEAVNKVVAAMIKGCPP